MSEEIKEVKSGEEVELDVSRAMVYFPSSAVKVVITATIFDGDKLSTVESTLSMDDVRAAIKDAEENYIGPDDKFVVTEEGLKWLEELTKGDE